jgi:hypothetical protein
MDHDDINLLDGVFNTTTPRQETRAISKDKEDSVGTDTKERRRSSGIRDSPLNTSSNDEDGEVEAEPSDSPVPTKTLLVKYSHLTQKNRERKLFDIYLAQTLHAADRAGLPHSPKNERRL